MTPRERVEAVAVRRLAALSPRTKRLIAGAPHRRDGLELELDAQFVLKIDSLNPRPPVQERGPEGGREDLRASCFSVRGWPIELAEVRDLRVAGGLAARLYVPEEVAADPAAPLLVFFHGGGWVVGDLDTHDAPCRALALHAGVRVLSVDYGRAPENPYPGPVDDAVAAFRWAVEHAAELRADPARIAVGGDSAGGHLSAMVCLRAAAEGGPQPAFQLLVYPATDFVEDSESVLRFREGYLLTKANMDWYEAQFLQGADKAEASPLHAPSVEGVAPALVVTAGFDPLRDEGEAYAQRLRDAGVPTVLRRFPGQIHGFINMLAFASCRAHVAEIAGVLRGALAEGARTVEPLAAARS